METYLITFHAPTETIASNIVSKIRESTMWARINETSWLVQSDMNCAELRDEIREADREVDNLLVIRVTGRAWATFRVSMEVTKWMKENL